MCFVVFKQVYFDIGIFQCVMFILNLFVNGMFICFGCYCNLDMELMYLLDIFECVVIEVFKFVVYNKKFIIFFWEIQIFVCFIFFGEFVKYVVFEGIKVVIKYFFFMK